MIQNENRTMFFKGNVIFNKGLEIIMMLEHVICCIFSVSIMISHVTIKLIT